MLSIETHSTLDFQHILRTVCFASFVLTVSAADSAGVKRIHADIGPLKLPTSAFSASSVFQNQPDYQAHKANLAVFASQEQASGSWCPNRAVQNQLAEWLQIDFGELKIMRVLFTEGNNQNSYVPAFLLRYQRLDGRGWYDYRMRNGTKLLYANFNSQTTAITLDPPIVAKRFRLYPYNELEPRFMCLRIAVYGTPFEDGAVEYAIPEGGIYRMDPRMQISLNDTDYDGVWTSLTLNSQNSRNLEETRERRGYFHGGLGLLMDKNYYDGQLPESGDNHNVVGWFRRQYSSPTDRVIMMFTFDQVRNFTSLRIHALNSLDYVAIFRRIAVQFSIGGDYFDRRYDPVVEDIPRDSYDRQARWIPLKLGGRIGRFIRVTLWFDYDWIVLSEITFKSTLVEGDKFPAEQASDPPRRPADLGLSDSEMFGPWLESVAMKRVNKDPEAIPGQVTDTVSTENEDPDPMERNSLTEASLEVLSRDPHATTPYVIAVLCCCLGSIAFVTLFVFMMYRVRRYRRGRLKKLRNSSTPNNKTHQLLLTNNQNTQYTSSSYSQDPLLADGTFPSVFSNSFQYNQLKSPMSPQFGQFTALPNTIDGSMFPVLNSPESGFSVPMLPAHATFPQTHFDAMGTPSYNHFSPGMDHEGLLSMQLLSQGQNFNSTGGTTLSRRGGLEVPSYFTPHPFLPANPNNLANFGQAIQRVPLSGNLSSMNHNFCPPPPPDQPLPPLPPPSTSPDSNSLLQSMTDGGFTQRNPHGHNNPYSGNNYSADGNFLVSLDGSMPEYASASLLSVSGSAQQSLADPNTTGAKSQTIDPETGKYRNISETYCIPHQNSIHQYLWPTSQSYFAPSRLQQTITECQPGIQDSNGMYYLANACDAPPVQTNGGLFFRDCYNPAQTIFIPFTSCDQNTQIRMANPGNAVWNPRRSALLDMMNNKVITSGHPESCVAVNGTDERGDSPEGAINTEDADHSPNGAKSNMDH